MLYLIGLGLNYNSLSKHALDIVSRCKRIYLENYTVDFPYATSDLVEFLGKKIEIAGRDLVEGLSLVDEAKKKDIALLIYGNPLVATTHITLIEECKASEVGCEVLHNASILDAVGETGLQVYKFGKITSMPKWEPSKNYTPDSFMEVVKQNKSIGAHSLILIDIGLGFRYSLRQLVDAAKNHEIKLGRILVCRVLGTPRAKIYYEKIEDMEDWERIYPPYCLIIPGKLNHVEEAHLKGMK